jgi:hypothetical protein
MMEVAPWMVSRWQVPRICNCGSGNSSWWEFDANNIALCRVCTQCIQEKLAKYRPEILTGYTQADVDEPIEAEEF